MLSPGVLFPAGYVILYLSTNMYLNADFKKNLSKSVERATGNTWQTSIQSIKSSWAFDSFTLRHIELTKATKPGMGADAVNRTITINNIRIPFPNLQKILFSSSELQTSTNTLCEKILAEKRLDQ